MSNAKKQTYEEAVIKTVMWWSEKAFSTPLNQNNCENDPTMSMLFLHMNMVTQSALLEVIPDKIAKFEQKLTELLMSAEYKGRYERELSVDYHPCEILAIACQFAEISTSVLPCKTVSWIDKENRAMARYQYRGVLQEI